MHHVYRLAVELHAQVRQLVKAVLQPAHVEGAPVVQQLSQPARRYPLLPGVKTDRWNARVRQPLTQYAEAISIEHNSLADYLHGTTPMPGSSHQVRRRPAVLSVPQPPIGYRYLVVRGWQGVGNEPRPGRCSR